jgi:hydrogenase expression/formation protein HypE
MTIARDIDSACRSLGVAVTGGHTEVTDAVTRPIIAGDMHGLLVASRVITAGGARVGNCVLLTKAAVSVVADALIAARHGRLGRPPGDRAGRSRHSAAASLGASRHRGRPEGSE